MLEFCPCFEDVLSGALLLYCVSSVLLLYCDADAVFVLAARGLSLRKRMYDTKRNRKRS